ncbi:MAG: DNA sulfur modification protein DndE [Rhodospirillales bacterium]|nr:DNA sulfur modification protein DndE [Rhodospirillales bacterium]
MLDTIKLSQQAKDQLVKLKRVTGIAQWNVLCRWGFCMSLSEPGVPPGVRIPADSNVEMTWRVFSGRHADLYAALLKMRMAQDGLPIDSDTVAQQFRLHLHRGISYLAGDRSLKRIDDLIALAVPSEPAGEGEPPDADHALVAHADGTSSPTAHAD